MDLVEAAAKTRAICRECGATIRQGETRFGRPEGHGPERRVRWWHLACAAQAMPKVLLHALELGGWRSVPEAEQDELRALIERGRRRPVASEDSGLVELAGRSSSAMAAAAVLEDSAELDPERSRAVVIADALQARGDLRGELLALELAIEHAPDIAQARSLQREHYDTWRRFAPELVASKQLRLRWIGGFLRGAHPYELNGLYPLLEHPSALQLERLRFDFCTQDELSLLVDLLAGREHPLLALELPHARQSSLAPLAKLDGLELLRVSDRFDGEWLSELPSLRGLSLGAGTFAELDQLAACPTLELLELSSPAPPVLEGLARCVPALHALRITGTSPQTALRGLEGLGELVRLELPGLSPRELGPIAQLPELRELELYPGHHRAIEQLPQLRQLGNLILRGSKVAELEPLAELEHCARLALIETPTASLRRLRHMPKLRSLSLVGGDMRRIQGLERLRKLRQLELSKLANLELELLEPLIQLDTLVLSSTGGRPRHLEVLTKLPNLRRLSLGLRELEALSQSRASPILLEQLEVLELRGSGLPSSALLRRLPRLRRLLLPGRPPEDIAPLATRHPELALFAELPPRDRLDRPDPFDWRTLGWVPRWAEGITEQATEP